MTVLGFHASHEQVHPAAFLEAVQHAEQVGFTAAMCSDHFSPWSVQQGHSAFPWSWLDVFGEQVLPQLDVTVKAAA